MDTASSQNTVGASPACESLIVDFDALFDGFRPKPGGAGYLTSEIRAATGWSKEATRVRLRQALESGICTRGRRMIERIDGGITPVTSYIFKA